MTKFVVPLLAMAIAAASPAAWAQQKDLVTVPPVPHAYHPKKTPWGEPDLRGTWPIDHLNFTPLQRTAAQGDRAFLTDEEYAARVKQLTERAGQYADEEKKGKLGMGHWVEVGTPNRRTSLLIVPANGQLPAQTAEGKRRGKLMRSSYRADEKTYDWVTDFDSWDRCITRGMPASMFPFNYNNGIRLFQSPGVVALQLEMVHETRIIPTDGRPGLPGQVSNWLGVSRGHWEGDTLVIETDHLKSGPSATHAGTWGSPRNNDTPISDEARIVERITMTGPDTAVYEVTYADPVVFTAPWTARLDWRRNEKYVLYEYACHEADSQISGLITSSRAARAQAAKGQAQAQVWSPG